ncbi:MAG: deoxynucleoside kinase [Deltaproteobacteria bacterium]|jgi:deoxyadenosine/deoxycytidine kinase|nr:deoxynucleoside kinase [Deltaproteobacteria bacterium]
MKQRIEICGNIASGKTTLCQGMAQNGYHSIYENFHKNPFFEDFYENPVAYSFETEVTFLLQHYHLLKTQKRNSPLACDYSLLLDMAYADVNLAGDRLKIFFEIVEELQRELGFPSQIVHLVCPEDVLLQRIITRSRDAETSITIEYLNALSKALSQRVQGIINRVPVITIDSNAVNFTSGIDGIQEFKSIIYLLSS